LPGKVLYELSVSPLEQEVLVVMGILCRLLTVHSISVIELVTLTTFKIRAFAAYEGDI
jgi:hypothetical protein